MNYPFKVSSEQMLESLERRMFGFFFVFDMSKILSSRWLAKVKKVGNWKDFGMKQMKTLKENVKLK